MGFPSPVFADLLEQIVHPLANSDMAGAKPDLRKKKFGKVELDCIMLDQQLKNVAFPPFGLFPTYCFDPGKTSLRLVYDVGAEVFLRNSVGRFQGHEIATQVTLQLGDTKAASAQVAALTTIDPETVDFTPSTDLEPSSPRAARISAAVMAGSILSKPNPRYPESAKQNHIQGSVILHAFITKDGNIRSLRLVGAPDPDLAIAAIAAVKQWRYKPYLINGEPTEVETTITVNFSFG
jgi:TonB family protein